MRLEARFVVLAFALLARCAWAEIVVQDDAGQTLHLAAPARRIISLAPHVTEDLYAAGAGGFIVGAVDYSDYPEAAKKLPRVGGYDNPDMEAIVALHPDLVIAWQNGNPDTLLAKLKTLGLPTFISQPRKIDDIATSIARFGELAGTTSTALDAARRFRARHAELFRRYAAKPTVRVFYQVWKQPLLTVNGEQLISDVMRLCGAQNVFASQSALWPAVSVEAVLNADPEAIVAGGMAQVQSDWLEPWRRWRDLTATRRGNLFFIPPNLMNRHVPRVLDGAQMLCEQMETVRMRRPGAETGAR